LREGAQTILAKSREDRVTDLEARDARAGTFDDPTHVAAEDEREPVLHERLHAAIPDLEIDRVHARGAHIDEEIARLWLWLPHVAQRENLRATIVIDRERLHDAQSNVSRSETTPPRPLAARHATCYSRGSRSPTGRSGG